MKESRKWRIDMDTQQDVEILIQPRKIRIDENCDEVIKMFTILLSEQVRGYEFWGHDTTLSMYYLGDQLDDWEYDCRRQYHLQIRYGILRVLTRKPYPIRTYLLCNPAVDPEEVLAELVQILQFGPKVLR